MWFLIRAVFWLSIVFALMPWPEGAGLHSSTAIWTGARNAIGAAVGQARAKSQQLCTDAPIACLEAAAKLGQLTVDKRPDEARPKAEVKTVPAGGPPR
ncbi:hypothetical protein [Methylocella tundrae]|jgi:hypothetical protein|uniref:Uncharacterized protein n=1 Tax=Methylocella tundrae TaxID=227605 RepID=A0A4U8Z4W3_METTU|nr:hypothetical protein [Methylocella tundrae]WPP04101.1 hypothetical protein SIN04_16845 [Methylocella tundrae]VFU10353.1 conserved protein of unknown function [Methylocella tundrae]